MRNETQSCACLRQWRSVVFLNKPAKIDRLAKGENICKDDEDSDEDALMVVNAIIEASLGGSGG